VTRAEQSRPDDFYDPDFYENRVGPGDRVSDLYLAAAKERGGPILDIGCGTGDVLIPLARAGIPTFGIDASSRMLTACRRRVAAEPEDVRARIGLAEMLMEKLDERVLPADFGQIFVPNDTLQHILDFEDLRSALDSFFRLLRPGGRLMFDASRFDVEYLGRFSGRDSEMLRYRGRFSIGPESIVQVWERTQYDGRTRILQADFRYDHLDESGCVARTVWRTLRLCPRTLHELVLALQNAGFVAVRAEPLAGHVPASDGHLLTAVHPEATSQRA
jgi:SAM-dependent methyltransferase